VAHTRAAGVQRSQRHARRLHMKISARRRPLPRWLPWVGVAAVALSAGLWLASPYLFTRGQAAEPKDPPAPSKAEDKQPQTQGRPQAEEPREKLPIAQVILYSSGVGYFQREGTIEGDARVDLSFDVRDVNDLIKSMTLRDLDGGHVAAVNYDSNAPVE